MNMKEEEIKKLVLDLGSLDKPVMPVVKKTALKGHILSRIGVEEQLLADVYEASKAPLLSATQKARIKESILAQIEVGLRKRFSLSGFLSFNKKLLSSTLALVIVFGTFAFVRGQDSVVVASSFVNALDGGVTIYRDGEAIKVGVGTELKEGDVIITGDDGTMEIYFFNDSKSRLAPNTQIVVDKLSEAGGRIANDYVEVDLVDGRLWSKVINFSENSASFVVDADKTYISAHRAAFDVIVNDGDLEVGVFNQDVEVSKGKDVQKVVSGEKLIVDKGASVVTEINEGEKQIAWVQDNLKSDKAYLTEVEKRLLTAKFESEGINVDDNFNFKESLQDMSVSFLTFDDVKKKKSELNQAEEKFVLAQAKLYGGDLTAKDLIAVKQVMKDFEKMIKKSYLFADEIAFTDPEYAAELRTYVKTKLAEHRKDLAASLPGSAMYDVKKMLNGLELDLVTDNEELIHLKAAQLAEKAVEIQEVENKGDFELAKDIRLEYNKSAQEVFELIQEFGTSDLALIDKLSEQILQSKPEAKPVVAVPIASVAPIVPVAIQPVQPVKVAEVVEEPKAVSGQEVVEQPKEEQVIDGPFGVKIQGDKVLPPLF